MRLVAEGVVRRVDKDDCRVVRVAQTARDSWLAERFDGLIHRDDGWAAAQVAVVDDLEELLLRPGGRVVRREVVEHDEVSGADSGEELVA